MRVGHCKTQTRRKFSRQEVVNMKIYRITSRKENEELLLCG